MSYKNAKLHYICINGKSITIWVGIPSENNAQDLDQHFNIFCRSLDNGKDLSVQFYHFQNHLIQMAKIISISKYDEFIKNGELKTPEKKMPPSSQKDKDEGMLTKMAKRLGF